MKVFRIIVAVAAFAVFALLVHTQTRPAAGPANVAIIDSSAFSDEKAGIGRVMAAMQQIEARFQPLRVEIRGMRDALTAYAQSKGISLLIDANRVPIVYAAANLDITKDFIADYNRTHPAGAAPVAAPARPTRP